MSEFKFKGTRISGSLQDDIRVTWRSPSNIAIVKYWGKTGRQLPLNPSISMTLSSAYTETSLTASPREEAGGIMLDFFFEDKPNAAFGERISSFLISVSDIFPFLNQVKLKLDTRNNFPHSAGIASSASAFSALALCLCSLEETISGEPLADFSRKASYIARLGSGSACRSIYGGITIWGETKAFQGSGNLFAMPVVPVHQVFDDLRDAILLISHGEKKVSSSKGHGRMENHPFMKSRIHQANENASELLKALREGDIQGFIRIAENEALTLHALMMTSDPGYILMEPDTVRIINRIQEIREKEGLQICFTLDAGPTVHLIYFEKDREQVQKLIVECLLINAKQNQWIDDRIGTGPLEKV